MIGKTALHTMQALPLTGTALTASGRAESLVHVFSTRRPVKRSQRSSGRQFARKTLRASNALSTSEGEVFLQPLDSACKSSSYENLVRNCVIFACSTEQTCMIAALSLSHQHNEVRIDPMQLGSNLMACLEDGRWMSKTGRKFSPTELD